MPHRVSHPDDVPVFAGVAQRVLRMDHAAAKCAGSRAHAIAGTDSHPTCRPGWRRGQSAHLGEAPLRRGAVRPPPRGAPDAPGRVTGYTAAATMRKKPVGIHPAGTQNHLDREFSATAPNTKWVTDLTYIRTAEHWLDFCALRD